MADFEFKTMYVDADQMPEEPYMLSIADNLSEGWAATVSAKIRTSVKPRPRWIPEKLWLKLAAKFLLIEQTSPTVGVDFARPNKRGKS